MFRRLQIDSFEKTFIAKGLDILIDNYNKKEDEQICCFINDLIDVIVSGDVYISNESDKIIDLFCDYRDLQIKLSDEFSFFELNKWNEERKINKKNN